MKALSRVLGIARMLSPWLLAGGLHAGEIPPRGCLAAIPPVIPEKQLMEQTRFGQHWSNPSLVAREHCVQIYPDQACFTLDQLEAALCKLPSSAWPYGRIVRLSPLSIGSRSAFASIDATFSATRSWLHAHGIRADLVPPA